MSLKKRLLLVLTLCLATGSIGAYAQAVVTDQPPPATSSQLIPWTSNGVADKVTIENGTGATLNIVINVNDDPSSNPMGINVQNCGETTHIAAGSAAICVTNDARNPVTFSSDKEQVATGTYQITQQLPR